MLRSEDLAPLLVGDPGTETRFRQGVIASWNNQTGENSVDVGGATLQNLPILNTAEAIALGVGDVVGLLAAGASWMILGRITPPNDPQFASAATSFGAGGDASVTPEDLDLAALTGLDTGFDPSGNPVTVTTYTGKWLILLSARCEIAGNKAASWFGYSVSGAQTIAADAARAAIVTDPGVGMILTATYSGLHTGAPGEITIQPEFRLLAGPGAPADVIWSNRAAIILPY